MARRVAVALLVATTLILAGIGAYTLAFPSPPRVEHVEIPDFRPPDAPPPPADEFAELAKSDPVGMLAACLTSYRQSANGFTAVLAKRERVMGKLAEPELIRLAVCGDVPGPDKATRIEVRMIWDQGAKTDGNPLFLGEKTIRGTMFVEGKNNNQMVVYRPDATLQDWYFDPKVSMARKASRYCITDAGLYRGMLRTYTAWEKRKAAGELKSTYGGKRVVPEAGGRECYVVTRTCLRPEVDSFALDEQAPTDAATIERDGFTEVTVFIDAERRLQVGTVLRRTGGELVGEYFFRDVVLTKTEFPPDTFTTAALRN